MRIEEYSAEALFGRLNELDASVSLEAKALSTDTSRSILETVCSFSNEPGLGGGVILLGACETLDENLQELYLPMARVLHHRKRGIWYTIHRKEERSMCTRKDVESIFKPRIHSEDGRYWAEIPAMPGCLTVADTLDELRDNLIEAAQCWLLTSADMENYRSAKTI